MAMTNSEQARQAETGAREAREAGLPVLVWIVTVFRERRIAIKGRWHRPQLPSSQMWTVRNRSWSQWVVASPPQ
jgi:hypothetical protein